MNTELANSHLDLVNNNIEALLNSIATRRGYLEWVAWWKGKVSEIETDIRNCKRNCRQRQIEEAEQYQTFVREKVSKGCNDREVIWNWWYANNYNKRYSLKPQATELYALRQAMKKFGRLAKIKNR